MAHDHPNGHTKESHANSDQPCVSCGNHELSKQDPEQPSSHFTVNVVLPHPPYKTQTLVSAQDQAQDIRQAIVDQPHTFQYTCFHLEYNGKRLPDFVDIAEISDFTPETELKLVEDPYTEKDARLHVLRVRELVGAAGDRTDLVNGFGAGTTLLEDVARLHVGGIAINGREDTPSLSPTGTHPFSDYNVDDLISLGVLTPPSVGPPPKTIKALALSPWNPPPYFLRTRGHLLYILITTNEGEQYHITSHVSGFYVNKCANAKFDPYPRQAPKAHHAHSLLTLLSTISQSFDSTFKSLQMHNGQKDPISTFQPSNSIPASPWIVSTSAVTLASHLSDASRSQEEALVAGVDTNESLRDWNEEIQNARELPRETVQDRMLRERVISKLFADYNEAAIKGAVLIARGEVQPLNPTENRDAQIFVYNNIFFSFGADGAGTFTSEGGDEAARAATGKDVVGVRAVNQLDLPGLFAPGTVIVDYLGKRIVGQSIVPGIFKQREPGEAQIDYGGVEGKEVVAENVAFIPLFEKLSAATRTKKHPVWDKEGKRHDLEASVETKGMIGTDGRNYVLDLYRLTPLDVSWIQKYWTRIPDSGVRTPGSTAYPHRMTVLRSELVDAWWKLKLREYIRSQMAKKQTSWISTEETEQPKINGHTEEQVEQDSKRDTASAGSAEISPEEQSNGPQGEVTDGSHSQHDSTDGGSNTAVDQDSTDSEGQPTTKPRVEDQAKVTEPDKVDISGFKYALNPDAFSGQQPQTTEEQAELSKDEIEIRAACDYLHSEVMPRLVSDVEDGEVAFPLDGQSLTTLLHKRGINVRYLGKVAELADKSSKRLQSFRALAIREMVCRAFKHVAGRYLRPLPAPFAAPCVAHLLNCLLGFEFNNSPAPEVEESLRLMYETTLFNFEKLNPTVLQHDVATEVLLRFRFELSSTWAMELPKIQVLREIAIKLGLQLMSRDYEFFRKPAVNGTAYNEQSEVSSSPVEVDETGSPVTSSPHANGVSTGGKRKKKAHLESPNRSNSSSPIPSQQTFHSEDIINVVPVIKESSPKSVLAEEALEAGRMSLMQNQRELGQELLLESLSLHEQIYGILHPEVGRVYGLLSQLFYSLEDKKIAGELAHKGVIVLERTVGIDNHETVLAYLNLGLVEHASGNTRLALAYLRHALDLTKLVYGPSHPDSTTTINNVAVMLQHLKLFTASRTWFETSLTLSQSLSGPSHVNTATLLFQLAQALALDKDAKGAVVRMREAYSIFNAELGPEDRNTKEAETWLETLTQNAVNIAKATRDLQVKQLKRFGRVTPLAARSTQTVTPAGVLQRDKVPAAVSAQAAAGAATGNAPVIDQRSVEELLRYIEGGDTAKTSAPKKAPANPKRRRGKA